LRKIRYPNYWGVAKIEPQIASNVELLARDFWDPLPAEYAPSGQSSLDYWQPAAAARIAPSAPSPVEERDFWAVEGYPEEAGNVEPSVDWGNDSALPWFDPNLADSLYILDISAPSPESMAARRSRWLVQLLDIPEPRRRESYSAFFAEIFTAFPKEQTFRALSDLAVSDVSPDSVRSGCEFRLAFLESPKLASRRSAGNAAPYVYHEPEAMLSWRRAVKISELCSGDNPADFIDDDWFIEWLRLRSGHALYWSYLDYVEWRMRAAYLGYLGSGLDVSMDEAARRPKVERLGLLPNTGQLYRGQTDIVGVLVEERPTATFINRRTR
jgi:hypothetical protein